MSRRPVPARRDAPRSCGRSGPACATSAATPGCGRRWSARPSPICCSWARPRCSSRSSSRHRFADGARDLGLIFAAGGLGSLDARSRSASSASRAASLTFMYLAWTVATLAVAGYGLPTPLGSDARERRLQHARDRRNDRLGDRQAASRPGSLLGRVSSLDWLISIGLLPAVVCADRPGQRCPRRPRHADLGRCGRRDRHVRRVLHSRRTRDRRSTRRA